jgi:antitoxin VapB
MSQTRAFKSGNSQAVRIPADIAYEDMSQELTITRTGDVITIYPARQDLKKMVEILCGMPKPTEIEQLERTETRETDWD